MLFAGDLGLDLNEQLCPTGRYKDRRAGQGDPSHPLSVTPRANDKRTLLSFNALLRRICRRSRWRTLSSAVATTTG